MLLEIHKNIFAIDYVCDTDRYLIEAPFTFINWVLIEQFEEHCSDSVLETKAWLEDLSIIPEATKIMCMNILPRCDSILHQITGNYDLIKFVCQHAQSDTQSDEDKFPIPFIENIDGESPLHKSILNDEANQENRD